MSILVNGVETAIDAPPDLAVKLALDALGLSRAQVSGCGISKTSLDARHSYKQPRFVSSVWVTLPDGEKELAAKFSPPRVVLREKVKLEVRPGSQSMANRPVIVGLGPAGMFAGLLLARYGYRPIILERGAAIDERAASVREFWESGKLDTRSNVQFGEGGAGAFSDGKLTTRIGDAKCAFVMDELVRFGAPEQILHKAKPHVGTDMLRIIVRAIREQIISLGGEVRFSTALSSLEASQNGSLREAVTDDGTRIPCEALILAIGHSARDTFEMLHKNGFSMQPKPFSVGVRIEHLQSEINRGLYGKYAGHPALPIGEYQLSYRKGERGVYTFCMCPGGVVVPSSSEQGMVVTNGMSYHARDGKNANSAVAVSVTPDDFGKHPLDGVRFQQRIERAAFEAGNGTYKAPAQDVASFLDGKAGLRLGRVEPTYALGVTPGHLGKLFPGFVTDMIREGLRSFGRRLPGFDAPDAVLTGPETRTSSPIRIVRKDDYQSETVSGVYPCAEGAGYAGGIMSAAVDGLRCALAIIEKYAPPES